MRPQSDIAMSDTNGPDSDGADAARPKAGGDSVSGECQPHAILMKMNDADSITGLAKVNMLLAGAKAAGSRDNQRVEPRYQAVVVKSYDCQGSDSDEELADITAAGAQETETQAVPWHQCDEYALETTAAIAMNSGWRDGSSNDVCSAPGAPRARRRVLHARNPSDAVTAYSKTARACQAGLRDIAEPSGTPYTCPRLVVDNVVGLTKCDPSLGREVGAAVHNRKTATQPMYPALSGAGGAFRNSHPSHDAAMPRDSMPPGDASVKESGDDASSDSRQARNAYIRRLFYDRRTQSIMLTLQIDKRDDVVGRLVGVINKRVPRARFNKVDIETRSTDESDGDTSVDEDATSSVRRVGNRAVLTGTLSPSSSSQTGVDTLDVATQSPVDNSQHARARPSALRQRTRTASIDTAGDSDTAADTPLVQRAAGDKDNDAHGSGTDSEDDDTRLLNLKRRLANVRSVAYTPLRAGRADETEHGLCAPEPFYVSTVFHVILSFVFAMVIMWATQ